MTERPATPVDRHRPSPARARWAAAAALLVLLVVGGCSGGRVAAHAVLEETAPADGETVPETPDTITLTFNEPVSLQGGTAVVLDDGGNEVATTAQTTGAVVTISVSDDPLADGTYLVTWRVISQDTHPVGGTTVFHVGSPSAAADDLRDTVDGATGDAPTWLRALTIAADALLYLAALAAAGIAWFGRLVLRPRTPRTAPSLHRTTVAFATAAIATAAAVLVLRTARLGGGFDALGDGALVRSTLTGSTGQAVAVTVLGLVTLLFGRNRVVVVAGGVAAAVGFVLEGHTRTQDPQWLMLAIAAVHVVAAAAWFGGLISVVTLLRRRDASRGRGVVGEGGERGDEIDADLEPSGALDPAATLVSFSQLAAAAVTAAAAAGVAMSIVILPDASALVDTGYGAALLVKIALVAVALTIGAVNRRHVEALRPDVSDAAPGDHDVGGGAASPSVTSASTITTRPLWRAVRLEVAVVVLVIVATAVLVSRSPTGASEDSMQPDPGPVSATAELSGDHGFVDVGLTPARTGSNELWIVLTDTDGAPLAPDHLPTAELRERSRDVGPIQPEIHDLGDDTTYHAYVELPLDGDWEIIVRVRTDDFTSSSAVVTAHVDRG